MSFRDRAHHRRHLRPRGRLGLDDSMGTLTPTTRRIAVVAGMGACLALVPWSAFLARTLPSTTRVRNWALAWSGLDVAEAAAAGASAWLLAHDDPRATATVASLASLLVADAWFDVCTATPGRELHIAVAEALGLELPLAAAAAVLATRLATEPRRAPGFAAATAGPPRGSAETPAGARVR